MSSYRNQNIFVTCVDLMLRVDHIIMQLFSQGTPDCGGAHRFGSANPVLEILANLGKPGSHLFTGGQRIDTSLSSTVGR